MQEVSSKERSIDAKRVTQLKEFCKRCNIEVTNYSLLDLAFHHRSYSNEDVNYTHYNNERLEFLGDSVLSLVSSSFLFSDMKDANEGELSKIKAAVVSESPLAIVAKKRGLDKLLVMGKGEELSGGRNKEALLADCVEAVIGAVYLDRGYKEAEKFILSFLIPCVKEVQKEGIKDYKSLLQELYQTRFKGYPEYKTLEVTGPDHDKTFKAEVILGGVPYGEASGHSKKAAQQKAASLAYQALKKEGY